MKRLSLGVPRPCRITLAVLALLASPARAAAAGPLPSGGRVVAGNAQIGSALSGRLDVTQASDRAVIHWDSFSIGAGQQVRFVQPGAHAAALNRVVGSTPSTIAGQLTATGQVFLVNPNGIAITPTGTVDVGGAFVASTLPMRDEDFQAGALRFGNGSASAAISQHGTVTAQPGGSVVLLGGSVSNTGSMAAPLGRIMVGTGELATIDLQGDGMLQVALPNATPTADGTPRIALGGRVQADGGHIWVDAATAARAWRDVVNISGDLEAHSTDAHNGAITIAAGAGGAVTLSGQLDASGTHGGGDIHVEGGTLDVAVNATLTASATQAGNGGRVVLWSDERTDFAGQIAARGAGSGRGGFAEVSSHGLLNYAGITDLRAQHGAAGTLLLDPFDVTISDSADSNHDASFTATGNDSVVNTVTLQQALATANVTVSTGSGGTQNGDITVASAVSWGSGNTLTLAAARDINVNAPITGNGGLALSAGRNIGVNSDITASGGALNVSLAASPGNGLISIDGAAIRTAGGNLTATVGQTVAGNALQLTNATLDVGTGTATLTVSDTSGADATFASGALQMLAGGGGSITLNSAAASATGSGVFFNTDASLTSAGTIAVNGTATGGTGLYWLGSTSITAGSGALSLSGASASSNGVWFNDGGAVTLNATGQLSINGTSVDFWGMGLGTGVSLSTTGDISLAGSSTHQRGLWFNSNNSVSAADGTLTLSGSSVNSEGAFIDIGTNTFSHSGSGSLALSGSSTAAAGILVNPSVSVAAMGKVSFSGSSAQASGVLLNGGDSLSANNGSFTIAGTSAQSNGLAFNPGAYTLAQSGSGALSLSGASTNGIGLDVSSGVQITQAAGDLLLAGSSGAATSVQFDAGSVVSDAGAGVLHVDAATGMSLAGSLSSSTGAVWLSAGGTVTQPAGSISAPALQLTGTGSYALDSAGNQLQTIAADTGSLTLHSATDIASGTVLATTGITVGGPLTLLSDAALTIGAGAPITGASPVLSAGTLFVNNAGPAGLVASSGRWLVYAADPATSSFGGLDSANTALWNATYALQPPGTVTAAGNRYLFALQPTLTITSTSTSKTLGDDASAALSGQFSVSGYRLGVPGAFAGDSAATALSGAPSVTSAGAPANAGIDGSPYAIEVSAGSLTSPAGYALQFRSSGQLSVLAPAVSPPPAVNPPPVVIPPAEQAPPPVQTPPVQTPPVQTPPVQTPPVQTPPVQTPPVQTPPAQTPPAQTPPAQTPPAQTPPALVTQLPSALEDTPGAGLRALPAYCVLGPLLTRSEQTRCKLDADAVRMPSLQEQEEQLP